MYRIPPLEEVLEVWGSQYYPYRDEAHFETNIHTLEDGTEYVHAKFWRRYDFSPDQDIDSYNSDNKWTPFTQSPEGKANNLVYDDSLCFISIASFYGGEYPYLDDVEVDENGEPTFYLPGFYIDTQRLTNIYCYKLDDIKRDCGQDWSFLTEINDDSDTLADGETDTSDSMSDESDFSPTEIEQSDLLDDPEYYDPDDGGDATDVDTLAKTDLDKDTEKPEKNPKAEKNPFNQDEIVTISPKKETSEPSLSPTAKPEKTVIKTKEKVSKPTVSTVSTVSTLTPTTSTASVSLTKQPTTQPKHGEDCCSAISQISYDDINCLTIADNDEYIPDMENRWKSQQCGRPDKLPTDLTLGIENSRNNNSDCDHLWAYFNQIHEICYKYPFTKSMKVYNHFKKQGAYECFDKNPDSCKKLEAEIKPENMPNFNNFPYDDGAGNLESDTLIDSVDTSTSNQDSANAKAGEDQKAESELAEMEEDGGLTIGSLGVLGMIILLLAGYVLYWFCCSNTSKGYRQQMMYDGGYYDDDIDTDEYVTRNKKMNQYNDRINGGNNYSHNRFRDDDDSEDSDWSVDEQLGVVDEDDDDEYDRKKKKKKKKKKSKKKKKNKDRDNAGYDITRHDINSMPINQHDDDDEDENEDELDMNDAIEVRVDNQDNDNNDYYDDDEDYEENETLQNEEEYDDK